MNTIQHYSKSLLISLFLILSIGNVWGETLKAGSKVYLDITQNQGWANDNAVMKIQTDKEGPAPMTWQSANLYEYTLTQDAAWIKVGRYGNGGNDEWNVSQSINVQQGYDCVRIPQNEWNNCTLTWAKVSSIYFKNTVNWNNVYVYFYSGPYWDTYKGSGSLNIPSQCNQMKKISDDGASAIYEFIYIGNYSIVSFTKDAQESHENFWQTEAVYRGDYNAYNPMYIPNPSPSGTHNNTTYYNNGMWGTMHRLKSETTHGTFFSNVRSDAGQISFFATKDGTQCVQTKNNGTWQDGTSLSLGLSADGIFTATMSTNGEVSNVQPYTGNLTVYHLDGTPRDYKGNQGKLVDFRDVSTTYYDHYHMEYSGSTMDLGATMGNNINSNIANTLETHQASNCNVRYEYNSKNNRLSQTVIAESTNNNFLSVYGTGLDAIQNNTLVPLTKGNPLKLSDAEDWLYTANFKAVKEANESPINAYLMATYNGKQSWILASDGLETEKNASYPILGASTQDGQYDIILMYDYKTNRVTAGWKPQGNFEVANQYTIEANLLLTREENKDVAQITIKNDISKISNLQKVVLVMQFNNTSTGESQYKFSLPFDCRIKDIYGLPYGYMNSWGIQRYNGAERARTGWFKQDRPTFWEWMNYNDTLRAGEGYSLTVDKSAVGTWYEKGAKYLFFPSIQTGFNITKLSADDATVTYPNQPCNINLQYPNDPTDDNHRDRRKYDSNWKLIGPKNYNNIQISSSNITGDETYYLNKPSFVYVLDKDKKVYEAQSTTNFVFRAFFSYFVQFAGTITWQQYTQSETLKPAPRYAPQTTRKPAEFRIDLKDLNDNELDRTFVALSPIGTEGFDLNLDLTKIDVQHPMIYTISENTDYAGNTLSLNTDTVALVVKTGTGGSYTIALPNENNDYNVVLVDKFEQQVNVLTPEGYPIQVEPGITRNRFYLVFAPKTGTSQPDGPTTNLQKTATDTNVRKVLINGKIYIVRDNRLYDITGKILTR